MSSKTATSASLNSATELHAQPSPSPLPKGEGGGEGPLCRHFGECGGCQIQDLAYSEQLARKTAQLQALLSTVGWDAPIEVHPSPDVWYYRNKMEFSFQDVYPAPPREEDYLLLGLKRKKRWDKVLNLSDCRLMSPEIPGLLESVHQWARDAKLEPYNLHRQTGFLRHLVVREAKNTGERMVLLITSQGEFPRESFASAVLSAYPASTILRGVNAKVADVAKSENVEILTGPGYITETILSRRLRISPYTFFQTNSRGAALLYSRIREWLEDLEPENVLDLYCGSGAIGLCVADLSARVMGIETVASAVEDARRNAAMNSVTNAEFLQAPVEQLLPSLAAQLLDVDVAVIDPPRSGLHPTALSALSQLSPPGVIYVSCNPKAMAEDLRRLSLNYRIERIEAVDLFPHTDHIETLALLRMR